MMWIHVDSWSSWESSCNFSKRMFLSNQLSSCFVSNISQRSPSSAAPSSQASIDWRWPVRPWHNFEASSPPGGMESSWQLWKHSCKCQQKWNCIHWTMLCRNLLGITILTIENIRNTHGQNEDMKFTTFKTSTLSRLFGSWAGNVGTPHMAKCQASMGPVINLRGPGSLLGSKNVNNSNQARPKSATEKTTSNYDTLTHFYYMIVMIHLLFRLHWAHLLQSAMKLLKPSMPRRHELLWETSLLKTNRRWLCLVRGKPARWGCWDPQNCPQSTTVCSTCFPSVTTGQ